MCTRLHISASFLLVLVFALCCSSSAAAQPAADAARRALPAAEITGLVQLYGCPADPAFFQIRAVPVGVQWKRDRIRYSDSRAEAWIGILAETGDARTLSFSIPGLTRGALYQVGISAFRNLDDLPEDHPLAACRKIFWRGPERGLVVAGDRPVLIEGFVVRTELEVLEVASRSNSRDVWLGKDQLQFQDPEKAARIFRWRSSLPDVIGVELQIATDPFPTVEDFSNCDEPETGVVARVWQEVRGNPGEFQETTAIDFGALLGGRRTDPSDDALATLDPGGDVAALSPAARVLLELGAPIYIRAVPVTEDGLVCDTEQQGVSGWVVMAKVPQDFDVPPDPVVQPSIEPWDGNSYEPPYWGQPVTGRPAYGELAYMVIKNHPLPTTDQMKAAKTDPFSTLQLADPLAYLLVDSGLLKPGTEISEGTWFVFKPKITASGGDFISDFTSTLGGLGSAFSGLVTASAGLAGSFVDYMQQLSEQVKSSLAKAVVDLASQLPLVTESCALLEQATGDSCEDLVKQGIEYGLVSMGVPPSLPSWEELKEEGAQYLAAQVASAIGDPTGLSEEFTHDQLLAMVDHTTDKQTESRGGDDPRYDWVVPYLGFEPAIWTLSLKKNTEDNLPESLFLRIKPTALFEGLSVLVPSKFPEGSNLLTIPVVLPPNTKGIPAPRCTAAPLGEVSCLPDPSLAEPLCIGQYADSNGTHSIALPCGAVNYPGIYYRDAWLQQRYFTTACAPLSAVSFTKSGPLWLLLEPTFIAGAALSPQISAAWDGPFFSNCP